MKKNNRKGFTLAELLIVVAIIGVLVAISIPIFTSQLEKSREAVDAANLRAAYAEAMSEYLVNGNVECDSESTVVIKQKQAGWQSTIDWTAFGGTAPSVAVGGSYKVHVAPTSTTDVTPVITLK